MKLYGILTAMIAEQDYIPQIEKGLTREQLRDALCVALVKCHRLEQKVKRLETQMGGSNGNGRSLKNWQLAGIVVTAITSIAISAFAAASLKVAPVERDVAHNHEALVRMERHITEIRTDVKELLKK